MSRLSAALLMVVTLGAITVALPTKAQDTKPAPLVGTWQLVVTENETLRVNTSTGAVERLIPVRSAKFATEQGRVWIPYTFDLKEWGEWNSQLLITRLASELRRHSEPVRDAAGWVVAWKVNKDFKCEGTPLLEGDEVISINGYLPSERRSFNYPSREMEADNFVVKFRRGEKQEEFAFDYADKAK